MHEDGSPSQIFPPQILVTKISISSQKVVKKLVLVTIFRISSGKISFKDKILICP